MGIAYRGKTLKDHETHLKITVLRKMKAYHSCFSLTFYISSLFIAVIGAKGRESFSYYEIPVEYAMLIRNPKLWWGPCSLTPRNKENIGLEKQN